MRLDAPTTPGGVGRALPLSPGRSGLRREPHAALPASREQRAARRIYRSVGYVRDGARRTSNPMPAAVTAPRTGTARRAVDGESRVRTTAPGLPDDPAIRRVDSPRVWRSRTHLRSRAQRRRRAATRHADRSARTTRRRPSRGGIRRRLARSSGRRRSRTTEEARTEAGLFTGAVLLAASGSIRVCAPPTARASRSDSDGCGGRGSCRSWSCNSRR